MKKFSKNARQMPIFLALGERDKNPEAELQQEKAVRSCSLKTEYQHLEYFLSVSELHGRTQSLQDPDWETQNSRKAKTCRKDNDTSVQSQSERDKTVAGNEGGCGKPSR